MQKLSCEAISRGKMLIGIPGFCNVLLSSGGGLGRSLSCVGRSGVRLFMMLHGSVGHKLPFAAAQQLLHGIVVQKLLDECLHAAVVQQPPCKTIS